MYLKLRIIFTILAALCLVAIIPAGFLGGFPWFGVFAGGALLFFALMLLCKQSQLKQEHKDDPPEADFLNPTTAKDEKNEK